MQVYEETGFDTSRLIRPDDYIEGVLNYQYTRLYIVPNVPAETIFVPRTRKEIKACEWFQLDCLPSHKTDTVCKTSLGINANSFFMILPFVKRLKRWLADNSGKRNNGATGANAVAAPTAQAASKRRQRNKSTGDLDGAKASTAELKAAPPLSIAIRPTSILQMAAAVSGASTTPVATTTPSLGVSQNKTRAAAKAKNSNFKRQLFSVGGTAVDAAAILATSAPSSVTAKSHTSNPLVVARSTAATNRLPVTAKPVAVTKPLPQSGKLPAPATVAVSDRPLSIAAKFNGTEAAAKTARNGKPKKRRPIESFLHAINSDPAIQQWKRFTFNGLAASTAPLFPVPIKW